MAGLARSGALPCLGRFHGGDRAPRQLDTVCAAQKRGRFAPTVSPRLPLGAFGIERRSQPVLAVPAEHDAKTIAPACLAVFVGSRFTTGRMSRAVQNLTPYFGFEANVLGHGFERYDRAPWSAPRTIARSKMGVSEEHSASSASWIRQSWTSVR